MIKAEPNLSIIENLKLQSYSLDFVPNFCTMNVFGNPEMICSVPNMKPDKAAFLIDRLKYIKPMYFFNLIFSL